MLRNVGIMGRNDLSSILPVQLVPVVVFRVVGSSHHDSSYAFVSEDAEGDHGGANYLII